MLENLEQLLYEFCETRSRRLNLSERSIENRTQAFKRLTKFLGDKPFMLENVELYFDDMRNRVKKNGDKIKPKTIHTEMTYVKTFTKWLHKKKYIPEDWGKELEMPKLHLRPEPLVDEYIMEKLIVLATEPGRHDHVNHRKQKAEMRLKMRFALRTGLRASEAENVKGKDLYLFDGNPRFLVHSKGGDDDWQPFPMDMLEELKERSSWGEEKVFSGYIETCNQNLKKAAKILNISKEINPHFHMLRKVFGTTLARNGMPMSQVSRLMRHSDISITQKFYISYGLEEIATNMNTYHSLIRSALPEEMVLSFYKDNMDRLVKNDNRFQTTYASDGYGGLVIHIVNKEHIDKFQILKS